MVTPAKFLFAACQVGAERLLKAEVARDWPDFRFAYSRPGFVTFKLPPQRQLAADFDLRSTFARTCGLCLGEVTGIDARTLARKTWSLAEGLSPDHLHVWQRDAAVPGERNFEPGLTPLAAELAEVLAAMRPDFGKKNEKLQINRPAEPGQIVLDCIVVEPDEWWIGYHQAGAVPSRWPGGTPPVDPGTHVPVSRSYFKIVEGLEWSRLPVKPGDRCAEIGSAPGGASLALLERGLFVLGIDPAEMDEQVLAHPRFVHVRKRAADMKRREFRDIKWLFADSNVAPQHTLDTVEAIVTHREIEIRGMLLTLKLLDLKLAEQIPEYVARVRSWGYQDIRTRQLAFNRHEFCLAAK